MPCMPCGSQLSSEASPNPFGFRGVQKCGRGSFDGMRRNNNAGRLAGPAHIELGPGAESWGLVGRKMPLN